MKGKKTDAFYIDNELSSLIKKEAKRLGISKSLLAETTLANNIRETIKAFEKTLKRRKK